MKLAGGCRHFWVPQVVAAKSTPPRSSGQRRQRPSPQIYTLAMHVAVTSIPPSINTLSSSTSADKTWGESKGCLIKGCLNSTKLPKVGIPKAGILKLGNPKTGIPKARIPKIGITPQWDSPRDRDSKAFCLLSAPQCPPNIKVKGSQLSATGPKASRSHRSQKSGALKRQ